MGFNYRRKYLFNIVIILLFCAYAVLAWGYAAGISGQTRKNGNNSGCWCHNGAPSNNVNVEISGPDTVRVNETASYRVTVSGGPLSRGGTDIAVSLGELTPVNGSGLRETKGELTHVFPKAPDQGSVIFSFGYKAPSFVCIDTIFANGNSVNFDLHPNGDQWNYAQNKKIIVANPIGIINTNEIVKDFVLHQNYPNPFNSETVIMYKLNSAGHVKLFIYDIGGQVISEHVNKKQIAGSYNISWNSVDAASGIYFFKLEVTNPSTSLRVSETKRMVLIK